MFAINGYTLVRNDRVGRSGGVAIYFKKNLKFKVLSCSSSSLNSPAFEYIFCEVSLKNSDLFVAVVYRPPKAPYFKDSTFLTDLSTYCTDYSSKLIMGDFNCDINPKNINSTIRLFAESSGLTIVPHGSTHFTSFSESSINIIMVDQNDKICNYNS